MKVKDLSGRTHGGWPPNGHEVHLNDQRKRSSLHLRCRAILNDMYPSATILEEVPLPGMNLTVDFYLPLRKIVVECNGKQHYEYVPHFHGCRLNFADSKKRDREKKQWCYLNKIRMVELPYSEDDDEWSERIEEA